MIDVRGKASFLIGMNLVLESHKSAKIEMDEKMDEKFRTKKWTKNRMIFLKNNSQWSQKHKKGLTEVSPYDF